MIVEASTVINNLPEVERLVRNLTEQSVLVGIPEQTAGRMKNPQGNKGVKPLTGTNIGDNNAAISYILNHGSPAAGIPPRPHLVPGIQAAINLIVPILRSVGEAALRGQQQAVDKGLHKVGLICQASVRRYMTTAQFVPLAEATLRARRRRGHKSTRPLIEFGRLRQAYTYALEKKNVRTYTQPVEGGGEFSKLIK